MISHIAKRERGSSPVVGSSRKITGGVAIRLTARSNRRRIPPSGLAGGSPGSCGRNYVLRADGRREELGATAAAQLAAGDRFVIETPGGGGYGSP